MRTADVCAALNCTSRTVFSLRTVTYPDGHPKAGQPVLGKVVYSRATWHYDAEAVREYRNWIIAGKPLAPAAPSTVDRLVIAKRLSRAMTKLERTPA